MGELARPHSLAGSLFGVSGLGRAVDSEECGKVRIWANYRGFLGVAESVRLRVLASFSMSLYCMTQLHLPQYLVYKNVN